jgi:hypothetical protein
MFIDLSTVVTDPRIAQPFIVYRKSGKWNAGRFEQTETKIPMTGTIGIASDEEIEQIPEGDRVGGEISIHTSKRLYTTRASDDTNNSGTSDEVEWHGDRYKVYSGGDYTFYGYYKAIGQRMVSK